VITLTTIGYGDVSPASKTGRGIAAMLMPAAVFTLSSFIAKLHDINQRQRMGADKTLKERLDELNEVIEADDDGVVSPEEYIIFNLKKMGKVDEDTITLMREQFKALDADGSGSLDVDDIKALKGACDALQVANV
jgi:potassium channel subfamily K